MNNDDEIADVVVGWLTLIGIVFGACVLGLTLSIIKGILLMFGIETNL